MWLPHSTCTAVLYSRIFSHVLYPHNQRPPALRKHWAGRPPTCSKGWMAAQITCWMLDWAGLWAPLFLLTWRHVGAICIHMWGDEARLRHWVTRWLIGWGTNVCGGHRHARRGLHHSWGGAAWIEKGKERELRGQWLPGQWEECSRYQLLGAGTGKGEDHQER